MNSVSLITGGSRGIGRAAALRLAKETPVLLVGTKEDQLIQVCQKIRKAEGQADYLVGDVSNPETAKAAAEKIRAQGQTIKNLVLNAGISKSGGTASFPLKAWEEIFAVNFFGVLHFVKECLLLIENNGTIIMIPGTAGITGYRSMSAYCASKHALIGFARSLALEVEKQGILVSPLCPGPVDTEMTGVIIDSLVKRGMTKEVAQAKIAEGSNQSQLISPTMVAEVITNICLRKSTVISGAPMLITDKLIKPI